MTLRGAKWLLVCDEVPERLMRQAINEGVAAKQLHSSWNEWSGIGEVALAVPLEGEISTPRLYTFLTDGRRCDRSISGASPRQLFPELEPKGTGRRSSAQPPSLGASGDVRRDLRRLAGRQRRRK